MKKARIFLPFEFIVSILFIGACAYSSCLMADGKAENRKRGGCGRIIKTRTPAPFLKKDGLFIMIIIINTLSANYSFSPELEDNFIFNINGFPYFPPSPPESFEAMLEVKKLCHEKLLEASKTTNSAILINNNPLTLEVLKEIQDASSFPFAYNWSIVSFFNNDKAMIKNVNRADHDVILPQNTPDLKSMELDSFAGYPFIKKVFIPRDFQITMDFLNQLGAFLTIPNTPRKPVQKALPNVAGHLKSA